MYILFIIALLWIIFLTTETTQSAVLYNIGWIMVAFCTAWFAVARLRKQKWSDIYFTIFFAIAYTIVFYVTK